MGSHASAVPLRDPRHGRHLGDPRVRRRWHTPRAARPDLGARRDPKLPAATGVGDARAFPARHHADANELLGPQFRHRHRRDGGCCRHPGEAGIWRTPSGGLWNVLGLALLVNVVSVAIASMPLLRLFGDDRVVTFVTYPPFVWLPAVMVLAALAGHLVIFRALRRL